MSTIKSIHVKVPATLLALGIALSSAPVLSQSAMTPGGGAVVPQPRVAPTAAPPAPVAVPSAQETKPFTIRGNEQQSITQQGGPTITPGTSQPTGNPAKLTVRKAGEPQKDYLKTPDANSGGQPGSPTAPADAAAKNKAFFEKEPITQQ